MISYNRVLIAEIESIYLTNIRRSNNKTKSIIKIRVQKLRLIEYITFDCYLIASSHWTLLSPLVHVEVGECFLFLSNSLANKSSIVCGCDVACLDRGTLDERSPCACVTIWILAWASRFPNRSVWCSRCFYMR